MNNWLSTLLPSLVLLIELAGSLMLAGFVCQALGCLLRGPNHRSQARLLVAEGAIFSLSFKLAATLLKTIYLHTWSQLGMLFAIIAIRTLLKSLFSWERKRLQPSA